MNTEITVFIYFFMIAFIMIACSFIVGSLIFSWKDFKGKHHAFCTPLGFIVILGILEIFYFPIQYFHLENKFILYITLTIILIIMILGIYKWKTLYNQIKSYKKYLGYLITAIIIFIALCSTYYFVEFPFRTDDLYFYIPFVSDKVTSPFFNSYSFMYDFQGIYDFIAVLVRIYNSFANRGLTEILLPIGPISWIPAIILYWIFSFSLMECVVWGKQFFNKTKFNWLTSIIIVAYTFGLYWFLQTPYIGNTFRRVTIVIILMLIYDFMKNYKNNKLLILSIVFISLIAQTSTGFIFSAMVIYSMIFYYSYCNETNYLKKIAIISIGPAIYMYIIKPETVLIILLLYIVFFILRNLKFDLIVEKFINRFWIYLLLLVPILFGVFTHSPFFEKIPLNMGYFAYKVTFFDPHQFEGVENLFEFGVGDLNQIITTLFCMTVWFLFALFIYKNRNSKSKLNFFSIYLIVIFITFFNPWVIDFVSHYITSVVYFRIYDLFFNFLILYLILCFPQEYMSNKMVVAYLFCISIVFMNEIPKNQTWTYFREDGDKNYSYIYHSPVREIEVLEELQKNYIKDNQNVAIASQIYSTEALTSAKVRNIKENLMTFAELDDSQEAILQRMLYRNEPGLPEITENYDNVCGYLEEKDIQYAILDAQYNWKLETGIGYCGKKIFEIDNYRVFEMHYEWMNQNEDVKRSTYEENLKTH